MADRRLIDANEIVKVAEHAYHEWNLAMAAADGQQQINRVYKMQELCKAVKAVADAVPTVDAVTVVHGEWTIIEDDILMETIYQCSACGEEFVTIDDEHPHRTPLELLPQLRSEDGWRNIE